MIKDPARESRSNPVDQKSCGRISYRIKPEKPCHTIAIDLRQSCEILFSQSASPGSALRNVLFPHLGQRVSFISVPLGIAIWPLKSQL